MNFAKIFFGTYVIDNGNDNTQNLSTLPIRSNDGRKEALICSLPHPYQKRISQCISSPFARSGGEERSRWLVRNQLSHAAREKELTHKHSFICLIVKKVFDLRAFQVHPAGRSGYLAAHCSHCSYISSWNLISFTISGVRFTNTLPPKW